MGEVGPRVSSRSGLEERGMHMSTEGGGVGCRCGAWRQPDHRRTQPGCGFAVPPAVGIEQFGYAGRTVMHEVIVSSARGWALGYPRWRCCIGVGS